MPNKLNASNLDQALSHLGERLNLLQVETVGKNSFLRLAMNPSLKSFKAELQESLLKLVWTQWSALGVAGEKEEESNAIADPEALLLFTCTLARHDPRLFDEVLDWLRLNGWLINIMRLRRILKTEVFSGEKVLSAIASLFATGAALPKWRQLAGLAKSPINPEELFFGENGKPLPVLGDPEPAFLKRGFRRGPMRLRGYSQEFRPSDPSTLLLQLRSLLGITVRCEIVAYLFTHEASHPSQIARETYFFERTVQGTLVDMSRSGVIQVQPGTRAKNYWLHQPAWASVLNRNKNVSAKWVTWPPLFSALERIWTKLSDPELHTMKPFLQSSELRQLMLDVRPALQRAGVDRQLSDDRHHLGESYLPIFITDVRKLLETIL